MFTKVPYSKHPPRFDYRLTDKGNDLWPVIHAMRQWGDKYAAPDGQPLQLIHKQCGHVSEPNWSAPPAASRSVPETSKQSLGQEPWNHCFAPASCTLWSAPPRRRAAVGGVSRSLQMRYTPARGSSKSSRPLKCAKDEQQELERLPRSCSLGQRNADQFVHRSNVQDPGQCSATTSETRFTPTTLLPAAPIDALQRARLAGRRAASRRHRRHRV